MSTGHVVWIANPDSGRVAYVAGATLEVHTVDAGNAPTYIAAIPSSSDDAVSCPVAVRTGFMPRALNCRP